MDLINLPKMWIPAAGHDVLQPYVINCYKTDDACT